LHDSNNVEKFCVVVEWNIIRP